MPKKIVVVDDDPCMRDLMRDVLRPSYQVHTADDGVKGLEMIRRERPDLVVLDILMPQMHGFEVCKRLRQDEKLKETKILISSSKSYLNDIKTAQSAGADMYIVKPFDISVFVGKVEELLGKPRQQLAVRFWGTRGSVPAPGPRTQRYGGNTPCTELRLGESLVVIDAGTGLRELGASLVKEFPGRPIAAHIFIGHTHWDHIQGFPFFTPFYMPHNRFKLYGAHGTTQSFEDIITGQMHHSYFPVSVKDMVSRPEIAEIAGELALDGVKVKTHYLNHPGITIGFRFEFAGRVISYISDHEPYAKLNAAGEFSHKEDAAVAQFIYGSDLLICEAQYTEEEYKYKKSWGHSTFTDVLELAVKSEAKQLALFHHDPSHTDEMMDHYISECRDYLHRHEHSLNCFGAQEGMVLAL